MMRIAPVLETMMRINKVELNHIAIALFEPYTLSKRYGTISHGHAIIVRLTTDDGLVGLGEADPLPPFTAETPATVMGVIRDILTPYVLGKDPRQVVRLNQDMDSCVTGNLMARGAVDMALHDLAGKTFGVPAHLMLGGCCHAELPLFAAIGGGSPEIDMQAIQRWIDRGIRYIMIKMGAGSIAQDIERMRRAADAFKGQARFIVDANQGWTVPQALSFAEATAHWAPELIEQPVDASNLEGLNRIRQRSRSPLSADESLSGLNDAAQLIRSQAADVFSLKVSKNGGLSRTKKIAVVAEAFGVDCLMNSMLEFGVTQAASLQVGCTLPNLFDFGHAYGSVLRMSDDITDFDGNLHDGRVRVPGDKGLGIRLDVEKLEHYTQDYSCARP